VLFMNGAAGNIAPIYSVYPTPESGHLSQFRVLLGDPILAALRTPVAKRKGATRLVIDELAVKTPIKAGLQWPDELAAYGGAGSAEVPVRFLRIGDAVIWGAPVEMFCELALEVRKKSPFANTFFFGYLNGWLGYLPTKAAFGEGGYEPKTSPFTGEAEADVVQSVSAKLRELKR
jgi:neutral ceramidase